MTPREGRHERADLWTPPAAQTWDRELATRLWLAVKDGTAPLQQLKDYLEETESDWFPYYAGVEVVKHSFEVESIVGDGRFPRPTTDGPVSVEGYASVAYRPGWGGSIVGSSMWLRIPGSPMTVEGRFLVQAARVEDWPEYLESSEVVREAFGPDWCYLVVEIRSAGVMNLVYTQKTGGADG